MAESTSKDDDMTTLLIQGRKYCISREKLALFTKKGKINMKDLEPIATTTMGKKITKLSLYKEDVLFDSTKNDCSFLQGEYPNVVLKNRLQAVSNNSLTIASFSSESGSTLVKTSKNVADLIGQKNYDLVFSALCSVIHQELKLRAILALLTFNKEYSNICCQTDISNDGPKDKPLKIYEDVSCQTESDGETETNKLVKDVSLKRRIKRKITPFVVKEDPVTAPNVKRTVIDPNVKDDLKKFFSEEKKRLPTLPDIHLDEDSNLSMISNVSFTNMSVCSELLDNQMAKMLNATDHTIKEGAESAQVKKEPNSSMEEPNSSMTIKPNPDIEESGSNIEQPNSIIEPNLYVEQPNVEQPEIDDNNFVIQTWDGTKVMVPCRPEDQFHLATPYILKHVTKEEKKKLLWHQAFVDWNLCLERDENDNMPLHLAVMCSDVDLVRRQCLVLKSRAVSIDVKANGMTALEISIRQNSAQECTKTLVALGADPLLMYREQQTALHLAAEAQEGHVKAVVDGLSQRARTIMSEHEELHYREWQSRSDDELATHLLLQTSFMFDNRGYSPLMLAAKVGKPENVRALLEKAPETVNTAMPNSGNTALYIAVAEACMHASDTDNEALFKDCDYLKTVETLLEFGADPEIENSCGTKIGDLLQEFNIPSLCQLVANKVTARHFEDAMPSGASANAYMLVKNNQGDITIVDNTNEGPKKGKGKKNKVEDMCIETAEVKKEENDDNVNRIRGLKRKKAGVKYTQVEANKCEVKNVMSVNLDGKSERKVLHKYAKKSKSFDASNLGEGSTSVNNNLGKDKPEMSTKIVDYASTNPKTGDVTKSNMKLVRIAPKAKVGIPKIAKVEIPAKPKLQIVPILLPMSMTNRINKTPVRGLGSIVITPLIDNNVKITPNAKRNVKIMPKADGHVKNIPNAKGNVKIMPNADGNVKILPNADGYVKIMPIADGNVNIAPAKCLPDPALTAVEKKPERKESAIRRKASVTGLRKSAVKRKGSVTGLTESAATSGSKKSDL